MAHEAAKKRLPVKYLTACIQQAETMLKAASNYKEKEHAKTSLAVSKGVRRKLYGY